MALTQRRSVGASRRVAVVAADMRQLLRIRGPLLRVIAANGHKLLCLTGGVANADIAELNGIGAEHREFPLGLGPIRALGDRRGVEQLTADFVAWKPNVGLGLGLKPMVLAAIAAQRTATPRIVLIASSLEGLSRARDERPGMATRWLARRALKAAHALVVHNVEHEQRLREFDLVPPTLPLRVLPGAGVDLMRFAARPLPPINDSLVFAMITRRDRSKGIVEFCEAARRVKVKAPATRFLLATSPLQGQDARKNIDLAQYVDCVETATAPADTRALIAGCHVFVLPSHEEGMAHEVVEALACGRPAITSDIAGCRETVDERVSGVLVPPRDTLALAAAMESFLRRPDQLTWMSQASRHKAERRFDANAIAAELLDILELTHRG